MKQCSLDTNILLRAILNDIPEQSQKITELLDSNDTTFHIADLAIMETVYVLQTAYFRTRQEIVRDLSILFCIRNINCNKNLFEKVFPIFLDHPKLSFADCCLSTYAELGQATPLYTLDHKLASQLNSAKLLS